MNNLIISHADDPRCNLVLAHGAGAGMNSAFLEFFASTLVQQGINVIRFNFKYMQLIEDTGTRRPPPRMENLEREYLDVLDRIDDDLPCIIGGKSMGGRVASLILERSRAIAAAVLGYPFHPNGKSTQLRVEHLAENKITKPLLIVQGERDPFGNCHEVKHYPIGSSVLINWLKDGDHDFRPRIKSGIAVEDNWQHAANAVIEFASLQSSPLPSRVSNLSP